MMQLYTKSQSLKEYFEEIEKIDIIDDISMIDNSIILIYDYDVEVDSLDTIKELLTKKRIFLLEDEPEFVRCKELLRLGVKGYSNSYIPPKYLEDAIEIIKDGNIWIHPPFMQQIISTLAITNKKDETLHKLSDREQEIALLVADSLSNKEIATKLDITDRTVKAHLSSIFTKLDIHDRLSLALLLR
jgi:DNA-binding NarL/FixJ family response regulator